MKVKAIIAVFTSLVFFVGVNAQDMSEQEIIDRIKPIGSVKVSGAQGAATAAAGPRSGEDIYKAHCTACHAVGVLGAPKTHNAGDWKPRLDAKGYDQVWENAINGINAMPPMGTCGSCSNDDIKSAIDYMLEGVE